MCDPSSIIVLGIIFYLFGSDDNSLKGKFESKHSKHIKDLKRIHDKLNDIKNKSISKMDKKQAEQYYPLFDECSQVAHIAVIEFSDIHSDISKEIEKLDKQIKENKEPLKSKYIGEKKSAISMHKTMIMNVGSAKKLRDQLNREKQRLIQILRSK